MNVDDGDLSSWADRGVLMLNTTLTSPCPKEANASCTIGGHLVLWKPCAKQLIKAIDGEDSAQAVILWGSKAAALAPSIVNPLHRVFRGGHPSPVSDGSKFFCKGYFTCSNKWLGDHQVSVIDWSIPAGSTSGQSCIWSKGKAAKCTSECTIATCD
jgi:uracil-DNA glycosylase